MATVFFITGCASTLPEVVNTHEFNKTNSYAMNIAMQTNLMTDDSGLRDFDKEEIDDVRRNINKSKGRTSKVMGTLMILTGNLTGIIDITGGYATDLALSNKNKYHQAANSKWIVTLDPHDYISGSEAYKGAVKAIENATKTVLGKYGEIKNVAHNNKYTIYAINHNNKNYMLGVSNNPTKTLKVKNVSLDGKAAKPLYVTGIDNKYSQIGFYSLEVFELVKAKGKTEDDILKEITALLPRGYFYYRPSFETNTIPKSDFGKNVTYINTNAVVPSIYAQGKRYDFIKPENKKI